MNGILAGKQHKLYQSNKLPTAHTSWQSNKYTCFSSNKQRYLLHHLHCGQNTVPVFGAPPDINGQITASMIKPKAT